jgi:GDP-L-fucose synthase
MARASIHVMNLDSKIYALNTKPMLSHINVGKGDDVTIAELAQVIKEVVGFKGQIEFDTSKPDGTLRKLMDSSRLNALGWHANVELKEGLTAVYADFLAHEVRSV